MISDDQRRHAPQSSRRMQAWETQELDALDIEEIDEEPDDLLISDEVEPMAASPEAGAGGGGVLATDDRAAHPVSIGSLQAAHAAPVLESDDAYFHPGGRILSIADATIEGWRVEPTMVLRRVRATHRRSWIVLGLVALAVPLLLVAVILGFGGDGADTPAMHRDAHVANITKTPLAAKEVTSRASRAGISVTQLKPAPRSFLSNRRH